MSQPAISPATGLALSRNVAPAHSPWPLQNDVVLEGATLNKPILGRENVQHVMEAASKIYEHLVFTTKAADGHRQYLEWTAIAFHGVELAGVTVITRNEAGSISHLAIHHRPLQGALLFSQRLGERLRDVIDPSHFLSVSNLATGMGS